MEHYLVLTAIGNDRPGICDEIIQLVSQCECNIVDSRIGGFGSEFTLIMLLSGSQPAITQVETQLPLFAQQKELFTLVKRTQPHVVPESAYSAKFSITLDDAPGLIVKFTHFLAQRNIDLRTLSANTQGDDNPQLVIQISCRLPDDCHIIELQEQFEALCVTLNAKGTVTFNQNFQ